MISGRCARQWPMIINERRTTMVFLYIEIVKMGFRFVSLSSLVSASWRLTVEVLHSLSFFFLSFPFFFFFFFIYTAITKSRTFRWLLWPRSRSHSASLSSNASEKPVGGSSLGTNRFPDPSRSWSRLEQELLDWCLELPNPVIGPKLERVSSLVWRASCNILRQTNNQIFRLFSPLNLSSADNLENRETERKRVNVDGLLGSSPSRKRFSLKNRWGFCRRARFWSMVQEVWKNRERNDFPRWTDRRERGIAFAGKQPPDSVPTFHDNKQAWNTRSRVSVHSNRRIYIYI